MQKVDGGQFQRISLGQNISQILTSGLDSDLSN